MKKIFEIFVLGIVIFLSGCESKPITCEEGYYPSAGVCTEKQEVDENSGYAMIESLIAFAQDGNFGNTLSCTYFGIDETDCVGLETLIMVITNNGQLTDGRIYIELLEDNTFTVIKHYAVTSKVIEGNGALYIDDSNKLKIKDFTYGVRIEEVFTTEDIESLTDELVVNNSGSELCAIIHLDDLTECDALRTSNILNYLNDTSSVEVENGEVTIHLGNTTNDTVEVLITMNVFKDDGNYYVDSFEYEEMNDQTVSEIDVQTYYEEMFNEGFTETAIAEFCLTPISDEENIDYAINQAVCDNATTYLDGNGVTVQVDSLNVGNVFLVNISEDAGIDALSFFLVIEYNNDYEFEYLIDYIEYDAISLQGANNTLGEFIAAYNINHEDSCTSFFDQDALAEDLFPCTGFEIADTQDDIVIQSVIRYEGGLLGKTFEVVYTYGTSGTEYNFKVVMERVVSGFKITKYFTNSFFE